MGFDGVPGKRDGGTCPRRAAVVARARMPERSMEGLPRVCHEPRSSARSAQTRSRIQPQEPDVRSAVGGVLADDPEPEPLVVRNAPGMARLQGHRYAVLAGESDPVAFQGPTDSLAFVTLWLGRNGWLCRN